jgi:hypothetical protein
MLCSPDAPGKSRKPQLPRTIRRYKAFWTAAVATALIAGCGGGAGSDSAAAECLANVLNGGSCQHRPRIINFTSRGESIAPASQYLTASCIHQDGNRYVCQASDGTSYDVTYDGTNIAYQP